MNLQKLIKENGGALTLNLSNEEEYDYLLQQYGINTKSSKFPNLQKIIEDTRTAHKAGTGIDYKTLLSKKHEPAASLCDAVYIPYAYYDASSETLYYCGVISLLQNAFVCNVQLDVFDKNQKQIAKDYQVYKNTCYIVLKGTAKLPRTKFPDDIFVVTMGVSILQGQKKILDSVIASKTFTISEIISKVSVYHPIKKVSGSSTINVFYGRFPQKNDKDIDYIYKEAYQVKNNCVEMTLDMMGEADFLNTAATFTFSEAVKEECDIIMDFKRGAFYYNHEGGMLIQGKESSGFQWYFDSDWGGTIPKNSFQASNLSELTMVLRYKTENTGDMVNTLSISSHIDTDLGTSCKHLREFDLKVGCLAEGTLITMKDGSRLSVEEVKIGDMVMTNSAGGCARVRNTWKGKEDTMIVVETAMGHMLTLSQAHPIETDEGLIEASKLNAGMKVMTEDAGLVPIHFLYDIPYSQSVYNLELEIEAGKGRFFAEKIQVGDVYAKTASAASVKAALSDSNAALADEFVNGLYQEFLALDKA